MILIATIIPFTQYCFADSFSFLLLATIKKYQQQALNTIIQFDLSLQTLLGIPTITFSRYSVYQLPGKVENSSFSTHICPKNGLRFGISEN